MMLRVLENASGLASLCLVQQHLDKEVCIDKQSHSPSNLQRAI
jgi:hypothetical protein